MTFLHIHMYEFTYECMHASTYLVHIAYMSMYMHLCVCMNFPLSTNSDKPTFTDSLCDSHEFKQAKDVQALL